MPVSDYNKQKKLDVDSVSGTPTVSKATPILIVDGDDSTTGNGDIVLDWTNIADEQDIAVYDQNDNLLDYEIENFDGTNNKAVLWCYNSWVRDGTTQAKVLYGDNSANTDRSNTTGTWSNSGQNLQAVYHFDESSGQLIDSSSNNNDSGNTTGTTFDTNGQFDGSRGFDGIDDYIDIPLNINGDSSAYNFSILAWAKPDNNTSDNQVIGSFDGTYELSLRSENNNTWRFIMFDGNAHQARGGTVQTDTWQQVTGIYDTNNGYKLFIDGSLTDENTNDTTYAGPSSSNEDIGRRSDENFYFDGDIDALRIYSKSLSADFIKADYDASPKAGQVFFSQQAAQSTQNNVTDTATKANAVSTSLTSTDEVTVIETAQVANAVSTSLQADSTSSATDTVTRATGVTSTITSVETADYLDVATKANAVSTSQPSVEIEVETDTATKATGVSTALTSNEALPVTDTATKATGFSTTLTSTESLTKVDLVARATAVTSTTVSVETSSATDTATKATGVSTSLTSTEQIIIIETATKADAVATTLTSSERLLQSSPDVTQPLEVVEDSMLKYIKDL